MPLAKSAAALCSSCNPHLNYGGILSSTSSLALQRRPPPASSRPPQRRATPCQRRTYATVNNEPYEWPRSPNPTPYQILNHPQNAPYSKKRFYELVKVYHPDRNDHASSHPSVRNLSASQRLERYRLIVAANDLLSDPEQKQLYDSTGVGWVGEDRPRTRNETTRTAERKWRHQPHSAARNATWEDWERWHQERAARAAQANPNSPEFDHSRFGKGSPLYMSNGMFATLVVLMCVVGALAQRTRAEGEGEKYMQLKDTHDAVVGETMRRNSERHEGRSQDQRIDMFLRDREHANWGSHSGIAGGEDR